LRENLGASSQTLTILRDLLNARFSSIWNSNEYSTRTILLRV
jgi:hypothetical protein